MKAANYRGEKLQEQVLMMVSLLVLLKYGLPGITGLGRVLSSEEMQQMCNERRLVTAHLGLGIFLPFPLTADICVGHVILDDIRFCIWHYAAEHRRSRASRPWQIGPRYWKPLAVGLIEQALAAPVYEGKRAILSRRPETERTLSNPWRLVHEGKRADSSYSLLSDSVQKHIMAYLTYCYQELHMELTTLRGRAESLMRFFTWVRKQETFTGYPFWTKETAQSVFRTYASAGCSELKANTRQQHLQKLAYFFATLADLEYPIPAGYRLLYTLGKNEEWEPRFLPGEDVLDRVFRDGVCSLSYDPFARLALTIQYYCGTRVT
ncbi:MAG: hypothetical protein ACRDHW_20845, partial [Ktedonobacteraceae bacterium]